MLNRLFLAVLLIICGMFSSVAAATQLQITAPKKDSRVTWRPIVEGTTSDSSSNIWVVVHPMDTAVYWVQPKPTVKQNGSWKTKVYIGRNGTDDVGKLFEVQAFANPSEPLHEGLELPGWPEGEAKSEAIEVTRK